MLIQSLASASAHTEFTGCSDSGTPAVASPESATPVAIEPTFDEAFVGVYDLLVLHSIEAAMLGTAHFERAEVLAFAQQQLDNANVDIATLASFPISTGHSPFVDLVNVVESFKMKLDLPAGIGGEESFGTASGLNTLCTLEGSSDDLYLALVADLSQQKVELAQVAAVFGSDPTVVEFANTVIVRETMTIGAVVTMVETRGTPVASPKAG